MRIKKLDICGFKSFKDRTVIQFDAGITGIVGPNGCGKSNIVDALVWVMGEMSAKHLRGSSMEDVIFAGSEGYAPSGLCEVSLTLENEGGLFPANYAKFSEIMVTRRLHRSGESEYMINREPARLRDIQEIFMDTGAGSKGFSIIEQGAIGKIITAKPEDRRSLIEEAAGITKFKVRKKESQRRLQATDQNLVRLQDILGELKRQIDSLERQAQRAERYRKLKNQIEDLDLMLTSKQYVDLKQSADEAKSIFDESQNVEVQSTSELSTLQSRFEELKLEALELEKKADELQEIFYDSQSQIQKSEMQMQELKFEIEQGRRTEQTTGNLLSEQKARQELLTRDYEELNARLVAATTEAHAIEKEYLEKNEFFQIAQGRIQEVDNNLTTKRREMFSIAQTVAHLDAKFGSMQTHIEGIREREDHEKEVSIELLNKKVEFENRKRHVEDEFEKARIKYEEVQNKIIKLETDKKSLNLELSAKREEVEDSKDQFTEISGKLYGLENLQNNFEGFSDGVKNVLLWQKKLGRDDFHPVGEVVEVPQEYELAMEAALGSRLQVLLAKQADLSLTAMDHLKETKGGRSSFVSPMLVSQVEGRPEGSGVLCVLKEVIASPAIYQGSVEQILDGVAVVDSMDTALRLRETYLDWTFVTVEGELLTHDGILMGGSAEGSDSGLLKRKREIKDLQEQKAIWSETVLRKQNEFKAIEEKINSLSRELEQEQQNRGAQEVRRAEIKKDSERAETELRNAQFALERHDKEVKRIQVQLFEQEEKLQEIENALEEARRKKSQSDIEIDILTEELNRLRNGFDGLQAQVTLLQVNSASKTQERNGIQRQFEMVKKSLDDLNSQLSRASEESSRNAMTLTENQLQMEEARIEFEKLMREVEENKMALGEARNEFELSSAEVRDVGEKLAAAMKIKNQAQSRMTDSQLKYEQARMKEQYLIDLVRERYLLNLSDIYQNYKERTEPVAETEALLKDLRDKVAKIGDVNLSAIEEFEETRKRYEFLNKQYTDLIEAKEQLKKVIERINKICSRRFNETYEMVNEKFSRVFPVLFGGGEARLELKEDPDRGTEVGIEIIAKPPGKKMQNVTLMSGGEKALTAVALIFSIFLVKPSPYCLLDEVDAPLDDANVSRFNDLVKEMARRSQIILVTHNKHTMDCSGKLYGVTMQEKGVSTMVSVSLQDLH